MEINMEMNTERMLKTMLEKEGRRLTKELSAKFGFNEEEGLKLLRLDELKVKTESKKETKRDKTPKLPLPFCGVKLADCCEAIRLNHGLYTQCTNNITDENNNLCKTCSNQKDKNSNGEPTYGCIDNRVKLGDKFRDPKGKAPINYGNIMDKLKITRNEAEREAANQGLTIPEKEFEVKKTQRGRPKKNTIANDTSGSEDEPLVKKEPQKKERGRPKKVNKEVVTGKDIVKNLVKEAQEAEKEEKEKEKEEETKESEDSDSDSDSPELHVVEVIINGKKYLKSEENVLFDGISHEEIGRYDPKSKEIIEEDSE